MKINEATALLAKHKKGRIYPKHAPNLRVNINHLEDDWVYDNICSESVKDGYHKTEIESFHCVDMPPVLNNLVRALG